MIHSATKTVFQTLLFVCTFIVFTGNAIFATDEPAVDPAGEDWTGTIKSVQVVRYRDVLFVDDSQFYLSKNLKITRCGDNRKVSRSLLNSYIDYPCRVMLKEIAGEIYVESVHIACSKQ